MCGIAGFMNPKENYQRQAEQWKPVLESMNKVQNHRGCGYF